MNIHGKDIKIFTGNSNPKVAKEIAEALGLPLGKSTVTSFADGEPMQRASGGTSWVTVVPAAV